MMEEANNKFNANARLFSKDQVSKILQELDIPLETSPKKPLIPVAKAEVPETPARLPQGDVADILRQNFIQEDTPQE